jgi:GNAT superfamily N-acetyltransferase
MSEGTSKTAINLGDVIIKPLDRNTDRAAFCCGVQGIDNFCRQNARQHHESDKARVYLATHVSTLVGFHFLVVSSEIADEISVKAGEHFSRVKKAPLVYLGMLGVDQNAKGNGIGKLLMLHAMQTTLRIADLAAVYALTLDARNEKLAKEFYEPLGFERFKDKELRMFLPVSEIRKALSEQ